MKLFACPACEQTLFFENVQCTRCGRVLAYLPEHATLTALEPATDAGAAPNSYVALAAVAQRAIYRLCPNYTNYAVCNWAIPEHDDAAFCRACRLNDIIPNLSGPGAKEAW